MRITSSIAEAPTTGTPCDGTIALARYRRNRTLQLFGGAGYRKDEPVERIWRSVRANRILAGTSEIMRHNRRDTLRNSAGAHMTITARQGGTS